MRISRQLKITSLAVSALLAVNASVAVFFVQRMLADVRQLVDVQEVLDEAQMEMEINLGETARAILHYISSPEERDLVRVRDSEQDFERHAEKFHLLAEDQELRVMALQVTELFQDFKMLGDEMTSIADDRNDTLLVFRIASAEVDDLIDGRLQDAIDGGGLESLSNIEAVIHMEDAFHEVVAAIESYVLKPGRNLGRAILDLATDFERFERQYREAGMSAGEEAWLDEIDGNFAGMLAVGSQITTFTDRLQEDLEQFEAHLDEIDYLLDEEIQIRIMEDIARQTGRVRRAGVIATYTVLAVGLLIFATVSGVSWRLSKGIADATNRLSEGAAQFTQGNLDHRIESRSGDELGALAIAFNEMADRRGQVEAERERLVEELEQKNAELERFSYTVSHDLKSPLITITGFVGKLRSELDAGETDHAGRRLARIGEAADMMGELLDSLLELSRIGRLVNPPVDVAFADLAGEAAELLSGPIAEAGAEIDIKVGAVEVHGDRVRLREVLQNLIENSLKFAGDEPQLKIEIGVRTDADETVFYVRDNGIGIAPAYHDRVFDLFDQLDPRMEGTGTGLALVKRIVELHGGRIWIESEGLGTGAAFCIALPTNRSA